MSTQGPGTYLNLSAAGNILPMSFVMLDTANQEKCLQCGAGDKPIGVAGTWTRYAGGTPADDGYEAVLDEFPQVAAIGAVVPLICGSTGTWTAGVALKPDALGYGTPAGAGDPVGAISIDAATPGVHGRVLVIGALGVASGVGSVTALTANTTLTAQQSGQVFYLTENVLLTTPVGTAGLKYFALVAGNGAASGTGFHVPTGDTLTASLPAISPSSGKGVIGNSSIVAGDAIEIQCLTANTWYVTRLVGTTSHWVKET